MVNPPLYETIEFCRSCGGPGLFEILSFGSTPLADQLLAEPDLSAEDPQVPLTLAFCGRCALVQILETVAPGALFGRRYRYYSSFSGALSEHTRRNAEELLRALSLGATSFVLEIASNDGYMLRHFVDRGVPVLGIDPAEGPASAAIAAGIPTLQRFFTLDLASELASEGRMADLVIANNVLAHVADLNGFVAGIGRVLKPEGLAVIEVPYVAELVANSEFDTIYHQHLCYFSVTALAALFGRHGLSLSAVRPLEIHGGSLRLYVDRDGSGADGSTDRYLLKEEEAGLNRLSYFEEFANQAHHIRRTLREILDERAARGQRVVAYGAAAKGTTLLSYCGLDQDAVEYVVDLNTFKHGRYMPGSRIPIRPVETLLEDRPDCVLLLAWNFADEILDQQSAFRELGGQFIVPIPKPKVV